MVTGVGHEIDYTIADFVADLRAPTPSVAAELTCPDAEALLSSLSYTHQVLTRSMTDLLHKLAQGTDWLSQRLQRNHPSVIIQSQKQSLSGLLNRLDRSSRQNIKDSLYKFRSLRQRHLHQSPRLQVDKQRNEIIDLNQRLQRSVNGQLELHSHRFQLCTATMQAVSPLNTLERGYSITTHTKASKQVITDPRQLNHGDQITTYLAKGEVVSRVESTSSKKVISPSLDKEKPRK